MEEPRVYDIVVVTDVLGRLELKNDSPVKLRQWIVEGVTFPGGPPGWFIRAEHVRPDRDTGEPGTGTGRRWFIEQGSTVDAIVKTALSALLALAEHEVREALLYCGKRPFDPHKTLDGLMAAT
jgi:hypothetical protein